MRMNITTSMAPDMKSSEPALRRKLSELESSPALRKSAMPSTVAPTRHASRSLEALNWQVLPSVGEDTLWGGVKREDGGAHVCSMRSSVLLG